MNNKFILVLLLALSVSYCAVQKDLVTGLKEVSGYDKPFYSGYFDISTKNATIMSHYMFYPSQDTTTPDQPLVLWLAGGPGCSSLIGAFQINGPFVFEENSTTIVENPYSWNQHAHILYIESYPGVGFSTSSDPYWDDAKTAAANLRSMLKFFEFYPEYSQNDFYVSGFSYGGIYVPTLADDILKHNRKTRKNDKINLKGILINNGCTDPLECFHQMNNDPFAYSVLAGQGWFDQEMLNEYKQACGDYNNLDEKKLRSQECSKVFISQYLYVTKNLNPYDITGYCWHEENAFKKTSVDYHQALRQSAYDQFKQQQYDEQQIYERRLLNDEEQDGPLIPPCIDAYGPIVFLNQEWVKDALHIQDKSISWEPCASSASQYYTSSTTGTYYLYPGLIESGLRVWHYTGDVDTMVSTPGTLYWVDKLNKQQQYSDIVSWRAWYTEGLLYGYQPGNRQNAGQYQRSEGITLVTVKGAGHSIGENHPVAEYDIFNAFLQGKDLPAY